MSVAERIREANRLVSIFDLTGHSNRKSTGPQKVHCPLHDDSVKSARLYPATNSMHCFAGCGSFDAVAYVANSEGVGMLAAAEIIVRGAGKRWDKIESDDSEFWRLLAKAEGRFLSAAERIDARWELHLQALEFDQMGVEVDFDIFDRAGLDMEVLTTWIEDIRSQHILQFHNHKKGVAHGISEA